MLILTVDPGSSATKILWRKLGSDRLHLAWMPPEVVRVPPSSISRHEKSQLSGFSGTLDGSIWVSFGQKTYAVGDLAGRVFEGMGNLKELKYETAVAKILAACGLVSQRENLGSQFEIALGAPLPWAEWSDRERLGQTLKKALSSFSFRHKQLQVDLKNFYCLPEGGGLMLARSRAIGTDFAKRGYTALMLGYRDLSAVRFDRGTQNGITRPLGFHYLVEKIQQAIPHQLTAEKTRQIAIAIHNCGRDPHKDLLEHLVSSKDNHRQGDLNRLIKAIKDVRQEYFFIVSKFIRDNINPEGEEITIGGGTAVYFREEIPDIIGTLCNSKIVWFGGVEAEIKVCFKTDDLNEIARICDPFCICRDLFQKVSYQTYGKARN